MEHVNVNLSKCERERGASQRSFEPCIPVFGVILLPSSLGILLETMAHHMNFVVKLLLLYRETCHINMNEIGPKVNLICTYVGWVEPYLPLHTKSLNSN